MHAVIAVVLLMLGAAGERRSVDDATPDRPRVQVQAMPLHVHVAPGGSTAVAVLFTIPKGWHIYWRDPGDSGAATLLDVKASKGITVGPVQYSRPIIIADGDGEVIGYEQSALLLVPVTVLEDAVLGEWLDLSIEADWLVCRGVCFIGSKQLQVRLKVDQGIGAGTGAGDWVRRMSMPRPLSERTDTSLKFEPGVTLRSGRMVISGLIDGASGAPSFIPKHVPGVELTDAGVSHGGGLFSVWVTYQLRPGDRQGRKLRIQGLLTFGTRPVDPCWSIDAAIPVPFPPTEGIHQ